MNKNNTIKSVISIICKLLFVFLLWELLISQKGLTVSYYIINTDSITSLRIIHLTDIHNSEFGSNNSQLIAVVKKQEPDLILISGDLINNKKEAETCIIENLISTLCKIAPVYVSYGNQEFYTEKNNEFWRNFAEIYEGAGAIVLEHDWDDIEINGQLLRIGGIYGYCLPDKFAQKNNRQDESEFLKAFQDTGRYTILMSHLPYSWINGRAKYDWDIDLVFTGHLHGGQIRLPFIGGLYAPEIGWFPGQLSGVYVSQEDKWQENFDYLKHYGENIYDNSYYTDDRTYHKTTVILSRGLGNTEWVPRFNNIPEIVVTDLVPE